MTQINTYLLQELQNKGYILIKNVLNKSEIKTLKRTIKAHFSQKGLMANFGLTQPNAAVEVPDLSWIFYHPKILSVMGQLLGENKLMFTSHCDIHSRTLSAWHKDDGMTVMEGGYFGYPTYDKDDCQVYKVAIYLQDHYYNQGGLTIRKGSHKLSEINEGEEEYIKTQVGDIIIFDVRLTHTGQRDSIPLPSLQKPIFLLTKILNKFFKIPPNQTNKYLKQLYDNIWGDRLSIFFTYGFPNQYTISFAVNNMKRQINQNKNTQIFLPPETKQVFLEKNVILAEDYFSELVNEN